MYIAVWYLIASLCMLALLSCHVSSPHFHARAVLQVVFPACHCGHWFVLVVEHKANRVLVYASLRKEGAYAAQVEVITAHVDFVRPKRKPCEKNPTVVFPHSVTWKVEYPNCPQQSNLHNCGVYAAHVMRCVLRARDPATEPWSPDAMRMEMRTLLTTVAQVS